MLQLIKCFHLLFRLHEIALFLTLPVVSKADEGFKEHDLLFAYTSESSKYIDKYTKSAGLTSDNDQINSEDVTFTIYTKDQTFPVSYYIDSKNGDDQRCGTSPDKAWASLERANQNTYGPGDSLLFIRGGKWNGNFRPKGKGSETLPIVVSSYGEGDLPIIDAQGKLLEGETHSSAIKLFNQEYWEFHHLHIKNYDPDDNKWKYGILVEGRDIGTLHHFKFIHLEISDVNGTLDHRENGGIAMIITRANPPADRVPSNFDKVLVDSCYFQNISRCGFFTSSEWRIRDFYSSFGEQTIDGRTNEWYPSHNIIVRNSQFKDIGGNGLVIRVAESPLVEHNLFKRNGLYTTGNASYPYNCNNALWQFNEASHTVFQSGNDDAGGLNSDYFCKNTILQYNYSHNNDFGGVLVVSNGNLERAFNDNTVVRYNVFQNNSHHTIRVSGKPTNTYIYNNVIYVGENNTNHRIIWMKHWGGFPDKTNFYNNIFYNLGQHSVYYYGSSTNNKFSNNAFYGNHATNEPWDPEKITEDPLFVDPGSGGQGLETLEGYKVHYGSPAIDAGKTIVEGVIKDFYGNPVPIGEGVDVGIYEHHQESTHLYDKSRFIKISLSPNPANEYTILDIIGDFFGEITVNLLNSSGQPIKEEVFTKNSYSQSRILNLSGMSAGLYIVAIRHAKLSHSVKLIIN